MREVRVATVPDGREVAYRVMSDNDGPTMLHTHLGTAPIELLDEDPMYERFLEKLGRHGRLVTFDKPGIGASDPFDPDRDYLEQVAEAHVCVLDAIDVEAAWIIGMLGPLAVQLVLDHPSRTLGIALVNPLNPALLSDLLPEVLMGRGVRDDSTPFTASRTDEPAYRAWLQRAGRLGASAASARAYWTAAIDSAVRQSERIGPIDDAPPVLLLRRREGLADEQLEWWQHVFPAATTVTVDGADVALEALDAGRIAETIAGFVTDRPIDVDVERPLLAVLFTDIVDSTPAVVAAGDDLWRSTLDSYERSLARTVERHHGTLIKHTGDGALATFPSATTALRAAVELRHETAGLGVTGRSGVHVGEVEQRGDDIGGFAVHLAARVMGVAAPGEIAVSSTVAETSTGSRFRFRELGERSLKGIDRPWALHVLEADDR